MIPEELDALLARPHGRVHVKADGTFTDLPLDDLSLAQWQALVGGMVQMVYARIEGRQRQAMFNEDGMSLGLPVNSNATYLTAGDVLLPPQGAVGDVIIAWGKGSMR